MAKIIVSAMLTATLLLGLLQFVPRIHPSINIPRITVRAKPPPPARYDICLVGDCAVWSLPWDFIKVAVPLAGADKIVPMFNRATIPTSCDTFIVMSGTWLLALGNSPDYIANDTQKIVAAIHAKFPNATIHVIPATELNEIAQEHSTRGDGWHLNSTGQDILYRRYAHILIHR